MCLKVRDSTSVLVWGLILSARGDSFGDGGPQLFSLFDSSLFCVDGGWKVGSILALAADRLEGGSAPALAGHTFQFISTVTFLIANKLINYAAGALKTPVVTALPISACSPSLTENINLLLVLSIMEIHNSKINYFGSEWVNFFWRPLLADFPGGSLYCFPWKHGKCLAAENTLSRS